MLQNIYAGFNIIYKHIFTPSGEINNAQKQREKQKWIVIIICKYIDIILLNGDDVWFSDELLFASVVLSSVYDHSLKYFNISSTAKNNSDH